MELEYNRRVLIDWIQVHSIAKNNLERLITNPNDRLWLEFKKHKYFNAGLLTDNYSLAEEVLSSTSWQTAVSTQIITEFDYKLVEDLTQIYTLNDLIINKTFPSIINVYFDKETQDLSNLETTIWQLKLLFQELIGQENLWLMALDQKLAELE